MGNAQNASQHEMPKLLLLWFWAVQASKERKLGPFAVPPDQQPHQTLDGIHKKMGKAGSLRTVVVKQHMLQLRASQESLVLLGIMSGSEAMRALARCTWLRVGGNSSGVRTLFVVGK